MASSEPAAKPHAVFLPCPAPSHVTSTLKLAKLLHWKGFHITFVNTEANQERILRAGGDGPSFIADGLPSDFQFTMIPDGLPSPDAVQGARYIDAVNESMRNLMREPFIDLVETLNRRAALDTSFPPVSCIVSDCLMTFTTAPVGAKFGIPVVNFWPISATAVLCFMRCPELFEEGFIPFQGHRSDNHLETAVDLIPGMKQMRLRDFPNLLGNSPVDEMVFHLTLDAIKCGEGSAAEVVNTYESLEPDALEALSSMLQKPVYAVGPLSLLLGRIPREENRTRDIRCNLWEEETECLRWLNSKQPSSVLYVNFGSLAHLTSQQAAEFASGISDSGHPFLWVIRRDLVEGGATAIPIPEEMDGRGFTSGWCPQEEVLNHPAVGGFLTHCGWNSTMESLSAGVPMLCWPCFADQHTNCRFVCHECQTGIEMSHDVKRDEVASLVRELMGGEEGKKLKKRALELKKSTEEAAGPSGTSSNAFHRLVLETFLM
ncbi:hypothetical protein SAY87_029567 [Trapa incisa]|uniref:Glycosyltransferase n=1 Tax=Trapa incisa TaxID=236973 RepID=A0AAN7K4P5_9MYRT|nr:hypothetical protein SAY87_029567 [Trapa incisa]